MHPLAVSAAETNTRIANQGYKAACDVVRWDAANLPFRDGMVDAYVSDFPFGQRCGSPKVRVQLYQNSMRELARILIPGSGRAVVLLLWRKVQIHEWQLSFGVLDELCFKHSGTWYSEEYVRKLACG